MSTNKLATIKRVREALTALAAEGKTAEGIAQLFRQRGVKGEPGDPWCCPAVEYVKGFLKEDAFITVGTTWTLVGKVHLSNPPELTKFIRAFDQGAFAYLRPNSRKD